MRGMLLLMSLLGLAVALFVWAATRQSELVNTDMRSADQSAYMEYAKSMAQTNFQFVGDRARMPIYPGLMSFFYKQGMSDEAFFKCGKNVGIGIGLGVLAIAFFLFSRVSKTVDALTGTLITMFTVFAYNSPYFQTDVLFYGITLVLFYLLFSLVQKPRIQTAVLAGLVGSIGHLTKASVLPAILLAALLLIVRGVAYWRWHHDHDVDTLSAGQSRKRFALNHLCYACVFLGCFLLVIFPYIQTSKEHFGRYFYNVNSTFYMWYDSWEEVMQGTRAHGDRQGWPDMPEDQIPSFQKYVREHSPGEMIMRVAHGFSSLWSDVIRSFGYAEFMMIYVVAAVLLLAQNKRLSFRLLRRVHPCVLLFVTGYFLGYITLYAWWVPIGGGERFVLSLFLPAMLLILRLLSYAQDHDLGFNVLGRKVSASSISPTVLLFLAAYVLTIFPYRVETMPGAEF
jgi:hypothetical protein